MASLDMFMHMLNFLPRVPAKGIKAILITKVKQAHIISNNRDPACN